jgi:hypothetical protein
MRDKKSNIAPSFTVMHVALLLLCAVLVSSHATIGLYASYKSEASGYDSARVAKFQILSGFSVTSEFDVELSFYDPDMLSDEISITVSSQSEVSVSYDVVITMPDAATYDWLIVTIDGEQPSHINENIYTFTLVNTFAPGETEELTHTINFEIDDEFYGAPPVGMTNIDGVAQITVYAEQVD